MKYFIALIILMAGALTGCMKKELPVKPHDPGNVTTATVDMGKPYKWQVYYNLKTNTVVGQNLKTVWDIGFETSATGYHIILNSAKSMFALNTGKKDFNEVSYKDTAGFGMHKKWDAPSGDMDSTAIGNWQNNTTVYLLDRGYDQNGAWQGMEKVQILTVSDSNYTLRFAAVSGAGDTTLEVKKDPAYNLSFVSFSARAQVTVEPPKATWDIVFSQYTYIFYDYSPPMPYLVTGCLLNRYNTKAVKDTTSQFGQIAYANIGNYQFAADIATIGYNWKTFNGTSYIINTAYNYVIQTADGRYYKLHFTGFYNTGGVEGNPKWEYQLL